MPPVTNRAAARDARHPGIGLLLAVSSVAGALVGLGVAAVSPGSLFLGWLSAGVLAFAGLFSLALAWRWAGGGRLLGWMVALAFLLRLFTGVGLSLALPDWGYPEKEQQAGYLFKDAYFRDNQAWDLARSGDPVWYSFRDDFATDQYGGLLALSALVYRYLSPDAHRSYLIILLGALFAALGLPFFYRAVRLRWPGRVALLAGWIYVLYPDAIFFSASQMREPFIVGLSAVAFWAVLAWDWRKKSLWFALLASLVGMLLISSRVALALVGFLGLLFLLEYSVAHLHRRWRLIGWLGIAVGLALVLAFSWEWFRSSTAWDVIKTRRASGQMTEQIQKVGDEWTLPIIVGYGLAQPVLPAAAADDSIPFWKSIAIVRAAGWYVLAPFLVYSLFAVWRETDPARRRRVVWLVLLVFLWTLIASARGGGDTVDNPRYRSLFIPWMALLAGWSIDWALVHHDAWLWRWVAVEGIFLGFFTHWYMGRYYRLWLKMPFWEMLVWIAILSLLVLAGGWAWDRSRLAKQRLIPPVK